VTAAAICKCCISVLTVICTATQVCVPDVHIVGLSCLFGVISWPVSLQSQRLPHFRVSESRSRLCVRLEVLGIVVLQCFMSDGGAEVPPNGDVITMLRTILDQNSQILSQHADINARLLEVEKVQQRFLPVQPRPRSKCSDGFPWKCPVCPQQLKHLDSFLSHIRKFAVNTTHRASQKKVSKARCCLRLDDAEHLQLIDKFIGVNSADKGLSFAKHFLFFCRTTSSSTISLAEKHSRIMGFLVRAKTDPEFHIEGDCPSVSDVTSSGSGAMWISSGDDSRQPLKLRGV
jgi:hypothetical protein